MAFVNANKAINGFSAFASTGIRRASKTRPGAWAKSKWDNASDRQKMMALGGTAMLGSGVGGYATARTVDRLRDDY